jgi:hypothetical protein
MIQLSALDLYEVGNLFSRQDLRDSAFQDSIIKVLCLGKCFKILIKEKSGLDEHENVTEKLIQSTFEEETNLLNADGISILKGHHMTHYWQIRKEFLNYLEDFMTQDSLIGSTINTRSKKNASSASNISSKVSSPSVLSEDTEISKTSEKSNTHDFYPKHLNHASMPKPDFEGYRHDIRKTYEDDEYLIGVDEY